MLNLLYSLPEDLQNHVCSFVRVLYINSINLPFKDNYSALKMEYSETIYNYYTFSEFHKVLLGIQNRIERDNILRKDSQFKLQSWLIGKWTHDNTPDIKNAKQFYRSKNSVYKILINNIDNK